ncbi:MAG: hypothetical protein ACOZAN_03855 [Patescibacteria group bacterium]
MRKEVVIAVLIGLIMGLVITFGVYQSRTATTEINPKPGIAITEDSTASAANSQQLMISSPEDESVTTEKTISVTGTTLPQNFVVILVNNEPYITTSDDSGNFSVEVSLKQISNVIIVHAIQENGSTSTEERVVIQFADQIEVDEATLKEATTSATLDKEASVSSKTKTATSSSKTKS